MGALAAVFVRERGRVAAAARVRRLSDALRPFGANSDERCSGSAGLVRRTGEAFTPEDALDRGIVDAGGGRCLLFDGVLHHREELIGALAAGPCEARTWADGTLFARAWERWDAEAALRAEGRFAVVVWDPAQRVLSAVCSPLDSPPLYYSLDRRRAIVATAPRAIFAGSDMPRRLDDARLASSLIGDYRDTRASYYEGVHSLRPGEMLTVTPDAHRVRRYYDPGERAGPVRLPAASDYDDAARELLRRAVGSALRAVETPAILLSGGLDSQTVAVTALEILAGRPGAAPLVSFTGCPEPGWDQRAPAGLPGDEGPSVRKLAERYPALDARYVDAAGLGPDHLLDRLIDLAEMPPRSNALHWWHECRRQARAAGRRTVLNGLWGNATLTHHGRARLAGLLRAGAWRALWREAAALPRGRFGPFSPLLYYAFPAFAPDRLYRAVHRWRFGDRGWTGYSPIHPEFARAMHVDERARAHGFDPYARVARSRRDMQIDMLSFGVSDASTGLAIQTIHDVADRAPLGDRRLAEWCLGLPDEQYLSGGRDRLLVRRLMRGWLPAEVLSAPRAVQGADWRLRLGRRLPRIRETLLAWRCDPAVAGRLDLERLLRLVDTWPAETPLSATDHPDHLLAWPGLFRALVTGRFIQWANEPR